MAARERLVGVGVFVIVTLLLFAIGLFMVGDRQMAFARKFIVYTEFAKVTGLQPGAIVRVSGAKAGAVKSITPPRRPSEKFRIELEVVEDLHALVRADSVASIDTEGLVGGSYLAIGSGTELAPPAPPGSTIGSREPFEIADLMQQMRTTVRNVNETIDLLKVDVQHAIQSITDTVDSANQLIDEVTGDVKAMTAAGSRIAHDTADIAAKIRKGEGTLGKLLNDDQFYQRATAIAKSAEDIAADAQRVLQQARTAIENLQAKSGPVGSMTTDVRQTMEQARDAMEAFAENMEALKRNFLFRGFFNDRGYFNLADISPAAYRSGVLAKGRKASRMVARSWLSAEELFEQDPQQPDVERFTDAGRKRVDAAIAPLLDRVPGNILIVEGYAQQGSLDEQYLRSRARAVVVRDYLINKYHLQSRSIGVMPLGADSAGNPGNQPWDGVALAVFLEKK
jgi:phospholipid/cholesterol/gamma-HCH transport system substrate-binding protein